MAGQEVNLHQFKTLDGLTKLLRSIPDVSQEEKNLVISIFNESDKYKYENGERIKGQDHRLDAEEEKTFWERLEEESEILFMKLDEIYQSMFRAKNRKSAKNTVQGEDE